MSSISRLIFRCLVHPSFKIQALLRAVLRDEMIAWHKKTSDTSQQGGAASEGATAQPQVAVRCPLSHLDNNFHLQTEQKDGEVIINLVGKAITAIMGRLNSLSSFDGTESKVGQLVAAACSTDNLCRMDPAWHPWL